MENENKQNLKKETMDFINWMFQPENRIFIKRGSIQRIAKFYKEQTGISLSPSFVFYNKDKWIMIDGQPYDKERIPLHIIKSENFAKFAKENNIEIIEL